MTEPIPEDQENLYLKGDDLQKLSVIQALPELLETDYNGTVSRIIPKIQQELPNSSSEFHIAASNSFKLLFDLKLSINLLRPVLQGIESRDTVIASAWTETLSDVIKLLTPHTVLNDVLPFVLKLTHLNRSIFHRVKSCTLLGQIAVHPKLTDFEVKKDVLPTVQSLCQDCHHEVRAAMCAELPKIAQGLNSDATVRSSLLPCLVELSSDEHMIVRSSAVISVVSLIPFLSSDTVTTTIIPLVKKLCMQSVVEGDHTFTAIAKTFGSLLTNLSPQLTNETSIWFLKFYVALSKKGLTMDKEDLEVEASLGLMCREHCAYNLPAVTVLVYPKLSNEMQLWQGALRDLAGDPCYLVRKAVASCIAEVTRILGTNRKYAVTDFAKLLRDEAEEVLDALVPNISDNLELLAETGILSVENTSQETIEVARGLLKCQSEIFKYNNWRRKMYFLQQLEYLPHCMPADFIHQHFTQVVVTLSLDSRARPVRTHAVKTALIYLRCSSKETHRKWIRDWLNTNLLQSPSCYTRHIYINMCIEAIKLFSWKYFKEYFYTPLLTLVDDPVSTIRFCLVKLMPCLKQMLVLPVDRSLQNKLDAAIVKLETLEKDKDVLEILKNSILEIRSFQSMNTECLLEEKRKIEEEEKIAHGRLQRGTSSSAKVKSIWSASNFPSRKSPRPSYGNTTTSSNRSVNIPKKTNSSSSRQTTGIANELGFLGQHFYTDAGVVLPEKTDVNENTLESLPCLEETLTTLSLNNFKPKVGVNEENVPTVSAKIIDIENMSDEDLQKLETSTTNITDDVKVNLQKMNKSKSMSKLTTPESVKKRHKRNSCLLPTLQSNPTLKRRSLNITCGEVSRIPISFRTKKPEESEDKRKSGIGQPSINSKSSVLKSYQLNVPVDNVRNNAKETVKETDIVVGNQNDAKERLNTNETKENVPTNSIRIDVPNVKNINSTKGSCLPVLTRRPRAGNVK